MQALFCKNCNSLTTPGAERCRVCGKILGEGSESNQTGLFSFKKQPSQQKTSAPVYKSNSEAPYLPYEPRPMQLEIIADIRRALDEKRHIVLESGTGTGKTIVSLAASLEHAKRSDKKVLYLTRTISQSDQVMKELRAISVVKPVSGITITGRNKACQLFTGEEYENLSPNVLSLMCEDKKQNSNNGRAGGCRYFDRTRPMLANIEEYCRKNFPTSDELDKYCRQMAVCPYEVRKMLMKNFDVIVAPYIHILSEDIRDNFINNLGGENTKFVMIVDEAHNLIDAAREQESFSISLTTVDGALDECTTMKKPEVLPGIKIDDFVRSVKAAIRQMATTHLGLGETEKKLPSRELENIICKKFGISGNSLATAIEEMVKLGGDRMDALMEEGKSDASPLYSLATSLKNWIQTSDERYVRSIKTKDNGEYLSAYCIEPSSITEFMRSLDGAVHMSGTLQPLDQYYKVMRLPETTLARTYPSPFPPENRAVVYVENLTTKYDVMSKDPTMATRIQRMIASLCNATHKNTLIFFPSYRMMTSMRPFIERDVRRKLYWEESGQQKRTMQYVEQFRKGTDGIFCCVMGGSIAEGMDFPGDELCFAILVGIPYPPPSLELKAMGEMYDVRYGEGAGWKYLSETPAVRKMRQAVGRLIRTEDDRGMAVIIDNRASKYRRQMDSTVSADPVADVKAFFKGE